LELISMTIEEIDAAIAALEIKALRPTRELALDPLDTGALARITAIEAEIASLRIQRNQTSPE
jgi:hypothetical protein